MKVARCIYLQCSLAFRAKGVTFKVKYACDCRRHFSCEGMADMRFNKPDEKGSDLRKRMICALQGAGCLLLAGLLAGCHSMQVSTPPRTALEQLALSTATDRALTNTDLSWMRGKKVFIEEKYFESYDKGYAVSSIRECIAKNGALLQAAGTNVDYIVEIRSGALAMNTASTLIGLPAMTLPIPLSGPMQTPELALYKSEKTDSYAKFALFAYQRETGDFVNSSGMLDGTSRFHLYKVIGITWKRTDIPEFRKHKKSKPDDDKK